MIELYGYFRSSASYRVRIALGLKGLSWQDRPVNLLHKEQRSEGYLEHNPQGLVPTLVDGDLELNQSLAIIEYLDQKYPDAPLLPEDPAARAVVRSMAYAIAMEVQPLANLGVTRHLQEAFELSQQQAGQWSVHWMARGMQALEEKALRAGSNGRFCFGDSPSLADICLAPQFYNCRRVGCDTSPYPTLQSIVEHCNTLPAFDAARPERQPDCPEKLRE